MRRLLLVAAAGVILLANGGAFLQAGRNRTERRGGSLELTERELHLQSVAVESTATILRLDWNVQLAGGKEHGPAAWLDAAKLADLGFDCSVPLDRPGARSHYSSMPPRPVFLALEYEGDAWRKAVAAGKAKGHLWVVDAARDPQRLREQYPDPQHHVICRGLVRLGFRDREAPNSSSSPPLPRLEGWVLSVCPAELFVPLPYSRALREFRPAASEGPETSRTDVPRFAVRVCWGANYEPWIEGVRKLSSTPDQ